ncbi:MAG: anaerobic ribonucleoside-triphosphate reductase activating protein [Oscillospiraceae bacterium]|nr:anaerobic ribonucleoside-triphosphate reductase activating protein [Oscillospiraceae bacterium]
MELKIAGTVSESIVDGPGFRYTIFVQGCPHNCPGCHNPQTHDFGAGKLVDTGELFNECLEDPLNKGVTFSGGEPFCQAAALYELGKRFKEHGFDIWCYSGWTFEELTEKSKHEEYVGRLLSILDVLVDGRFIEDRKSLSLPFRGSENQRLIDVPASIKEGMVIRFIL